MKTKVFISYKHNKFSGTVGNLLLQRLKESCEVFLDTQVIEVGDDWVEKIITNLRDSDVLILLLEDNTVDSDWVRREIDTARGAGIKILPLILGEIKTLQPMLDKFEMRVAQCLQFNGTPEECDKLVQDIPRLADETRQQQIQWVDRLRQKRVAEPAEQNPNYKRYELEERGKPVHPCKIYLATGNIALMKDIDVLVNSENDYMQMARIFERGTVSSQLRFYGSKGNLNTGRIMEDTVQEELDARVIQEFGSRPIDLSEVIVTNAGHKDSVLRKNHHARYIFHVAAVSARNDFAMEGVQPSKNVISCVTNCLQKVLEVDEARGVFSPEGTEQRELEEKNSERYVPIKSIIFPIFGTGHAGMPTAEVVPTIVKTFKKFLSENQNITLERIYLCAYRKSDIAIVTKAMNDAFDSIG